MILRFREKEFWLLMACGLVLFHRPLLLGETFFFRDLHLHFFPQKLRFVELIRAGEFPLWDPFLHGGQPFLADLNNMALYPANLVYLFLPPVFAFNLDIIFHVLLSAAAAYWLARWLGISPLASIAAGAVYGFCGYSLSLTNLLSRLTALAYLPLMILTLLAFFKEKRKRWFALCVLFGVLQILAGAPEMTLLSFITIAGWLLSDREREQRRHSLFLLVLLALLVAGIAAIQILPTAEMVQQSTRSNASNYDEFSAWSLNIKRIPEILFPHFLGYTDRVSQKDYWGSNLESMGFPFILSIYFGWLTLSLAILGFTLRNGSGRLRLFLGALAILAFLLSLGGYLPGFRALFDYVPFLRIARYPVKFLVAAVLPVSLLAAIGLDGILSLQRLKRPVAIYFWCSAAILVTAAIVMHFRNQYISEFAQYYFGRSSPTAVTGLGASVLHTAIICVAATLFFTWWILSPNRLARYMFPLLLLADLMWNGFYVNHYAPSEFLSRPPELATTVKKELGGGRFYRSLNPPNLTLKLPANDVIFFNRWHLETLHNYSGAMYSIPLIYHEDYDNLAQKELVRISDHVLRISWEDRIPFLTAGGVSLILSADEIKLPDFPFVAAVRNSSNRRFFLYRNRQVQSTAKLVTSYVETSNLQEMFERMGDGSFEAKNTVLLLSDEAIPIQQNRSCTRSIDVTESRANWFQLRTRADCDSYLYLAHPFYKGWETIVDGNSVPSLRANYAFTAIFLKAGEHLVERNYKPASVKIGLIVTSASLLLLVVFLIRQGKGAINHPPTS